MSRAGSGEAPPPSGGIWISPGETARRLGLILSAALGINFVWEMAQMSLYAEMTWNDWSDWYC